MAEHFRYDWDSIKAVANEAKHGISFQDGATIFSREPQLSIYDDSHSDDEDRWVTMGWDSKGRLLAAVHTFEPISEHVTLIRIISVRLATGSEARQFKELTS